MPNIDTSNTGALYHKFKLLGPKIQNQNLAFLQKMC